jgi:hypothetical protein
MSENSKIKKDHEINLRDGKEVVILRIPQKKKKLSIKRKKFKCV